MKSKYFSIMAILLVAVVLVSGCTDEITCNSPYIKVGNTCCLDSNYNGVCDKDEQQLSYDDFSISDINDYSLGYSDTEEVSLHANMRITVKRNDIDGSVIFDNAGNEINYPHRLSLGDNERSAEIFNEPKSSFITEYKKSTFPTKKIKVCIYLKSYYSGGDIKYDKIKNSKEAICVDKLLPSPNIDIDIQTNPVEITPDYETDYLGNNFFTNTPTITITNRGNVGVRLITQKEDSVCNSPYEPTSCILSLRDSPLLYFKPGDTKTINTYARYDVGHVPPHKATITNYMWFVNKIFYKKPYSLNINYQG